MAVLQETHTGKATFFITFGSLVSTDQPTINYKSTQIKEKINPNSDFSKSLICICSYGFMRRRNMKCTNRTLFPCQMLWTIQIKLLQTKDARNSSKLHCSQFKCQIKCYLFPRIDALRLKFQLSVLCVICYEVSSLTWYSTYPGIYIHFEHTLYLAWFQFIEDSAAS